LDGDTGKSLKAKPVTIVELWFDLDLPYKKGRFDADTKISRKV